MPLVGILSPHHACKEPQEYTYCGALHSSASGMLLFHAMSICSMRSLVYPFLPLCHPHISHTSGVCQVFFSLVQGHRSRAICRSPLRPRLQGIFHADLLQCVGVTDAGHKT